MCVSVCGFAWCVCVLERMGELVRAYTNSIERFRIAVQDAFLMQVVVDNN